MSIATATIYIDGMTCQGCVASVTRALKAVSGVTDVTVSLDDKCATIQYDSAQVTPDTLVGAIEDAGFDAGMSSTS